MSIGHSPLSDKFPLDPDLIHHCGTQKKNQCLVLSGLWQRLQTHFCPRSPYYNLMLKVILTLHANKNGARGAKT